MLMFFMFFRFAVLFLLLMMLLFLLLLSFCCCYYFCRSFCCCCRPSIPTQHNFPCCRSVLSLFGLTFLFAYFIKSPAVLSPFIHCSFFSFNFCIYVTLPLFVHRRRCCPCLTGNLFFPNRVPLVSPRTAFLSAQRGPNNWGGPRLKMHKSFRSHCLAQPRANQPMQMKFPCKLH